MVPTTCSKKLAGRWRNRISWPRYEWRYGSLRTSFQIQVHCILYRLMPRRAGSHQLPEECGSSMRGIQRGDVVDIHADTVGGGVVQIVRGIVLAEPTTTEDGLAQGYIIAVPTEYADAVAELVVKEMNAALMLPEDRTINQPVVPFIGGGVADE